MKENLVVITDIEGVANNGLKYPNSLSKHRLRNLSFLAKTAGAKLVLNGEWRLDNVKRSILTRALRFRGLKIKSSIPVIQGAQAVAEINSWVKEISQIVT